MKPLLIGILVVIQLVTLALASDQAEVHASELCSLEDVAVLCGGFARGDYGDVDRCCQALEAANDRGCFCSESPAFRNWLTLGGDGLCHLRVFWAGSSQCADFAGTPASLEVLSSTRWARKLTNELISAQSPPVSNLHPPNKSSTESAEDAKDPNSTEETPEDTGFPSVLAAGMGGCLLLSCAMVCPCFRPKKKEDVSQNFAQDISINSISSSHDNSRSLNRLNSASSFNSYANSASGVPQGVSGALTFTMAELVKVTGNFSPSQKIGQGGFGTVYKGKLRDGTTVAVKRAKKDAFENRLSVEFQNELDMLSQVYHLNLVKLIGYLDAEHERILVVEYVPNGNLREHLDGQYGTVLDMATRLDIAIDVAHALTYLHLYADRPIIHRDVKSSNILLTDTFRAKVADFGFSRTGPTDQGATHVSTQVKGTAGYLDPEYLTTYQLNQKSDVYSFGILVIEIFTGRRPIELKRPSDERVTVRWAFKKFVEGNVMDILDPRIDPTPAIYMIMERLAELAFACSAPTKADRPSMKKAQEALWNIRKEYQAQLSNDPARSPSHTSHTSRATFSIPETDSRTSASFLSPRLASPTRSSPNSRLSPSTSNMSSQNMSGR